MSTLSSISGWLITAKHRPGWFCAATLPVHDEPMPTPEWVWDALIV